MTDKAIGVLLFGVALAFTACSFSQEEKVSATNSCKQDLECGEGSVCRDNLCVATQSPPLLVALQVTPTRTETASKDTSGGNASRVQTTSVADQTVTTLFTPFFVFGLTELDPISVPVLAEVSGNIRYRGELVPARIEFIPKDNLLGMQVGMLTATTADQPKIDSLKMPADYVTQILLNVYYDYVVKPIEKTGLSGEVNPALPPYYGEYYLDSSRGERLDIDYDLYPMQEIKFTIRGAPKGQALKVYAESTSNSGTLVSSVYRGVIEKDETPVALLFSTQTDPYQLVIQPDTSTTDVAQNGEVPQGETQVPFYPDFRIRETALRSIPGGKGVPPPDDATDSPLVVILPSAVQTVVFNGYIELCKSQSKEAAKQQSRNGVNNTSGSRLTVSLSSTELSGLDPKVTAVGSFSTSAEAKYNEETKRFEFAVTVIPGKYQVRISPPADHECGIFANTLQIPAATDSEPVVTPLQFPSMAYIKGVLQTPEGDPLIGATVQAQALGKEGIDLSDQPSLTTYNRTSPQGTTDKHGAFLIPVDLGSYDVIAKPPADSGFGWQVFYDVDIGTQGAEFPRTIDVAKPVSIEGTLAYPIGKKGSESSASLQGAEVKAFAVIIDKNLQTRTREIASTTADKDSHFKLLFSPALNEGWY